MFQIGATFFNNNGTPAIGRTDVTAMIQDATSGAILAQGIPLPEKTPGFYVADWTRTSSKPVLVTATTTQTAELTNNIAFGTNFEIPLAVVAVPPTLPIIDEEDKTITRCPYCFNKLNQSKDVLNFLFANDPVFMYAAKVYAQFKGHCNCLISSVIDLQTNRKALESMILSEENRTDFTELNQAGKFQVTSKHIAELRYSTEKLLYSLGMTKEDYFNYDEKGSDRNLKGHKYEWTDPIGRTDNPNSLTLDIDKINEIYKPSNLRIGLCGFQVKGFHIEDLRHYIPSGWTEPWIGSYNQNTSIFVPQSITTEKGDILQQNILSKHKWYVYNWSYGNAPGTNPEYYSSSAHCNLEIVQNHLSSVAYASAMNKIYGTSNAAKAIFYYLCEDITHPSVTMNENLNLCFSGLSVSRTSMGIAVAGLVQAGAISWYSGVYILINTQPLNPIPGLPCLFGYYIGEAHNNPGFDTEANFKANHIRHLSNLSGDVKLNLWNDYTELLGGNPPAVPITNIVIYAASDVYMNGGWYYYDNTFSTITNSMGISFNSVALRNLAS
jgi:hypothetical protein